MRLTPEQWRHIPPVPGVPFPKPGVRFYKVFTDEGRYEIVEWRGEHIMPKYYRPVIVDGAK